MFYVRSWKYSYLCANVGHKSKSKKSSQSKVEIPENLPKYSRVCLLCSLPPLAARELHSKVGEAGCRRPPVSSFLGRIQISSAAPDSQLTSSHQDEREPTVPRGRLEKSCRGVSRHWLTHTHWPSSEKCYSKKKKKKKHLTDRHECQD